MICLESTDVLLLIYGYGYKGLSTQKADSQTTSLSYKPQPSIIGVIIFIIELIFFVCNQPV